MRLSIIIPAFNEQHYIGKCLESIQKEITRSGYTHDDVEIIVVNNASTDTTAEIAQSYDHVRVVTESKKGLVFARKAGALAATGTLYAHVDADTVMRKGWIDTVIEGFDKDPTLVALSGPYNYYDLPFSKRLVSQFFYHVGFLVYVINCHLFHAGAMLQGGNFIVREDAWKKIADYGQTIDFYGEDTEIASRLCKIGYVKFTLSLINDSSGRRLRSQGMITVGVTYALNYMWVTYFRKPLTKYYKDIRY